MLIGIVGFIGSGKGTVGSILSEKYEFTQDSFAAPLKDAVAAIFGWDRTLLEGDTPESRAWREVPDPFWSNSFGKPFSPRLALQLMGTEAGRNVFHKDVWVVSLLKRSKGRDTIITDVRFKNEINLIRENHGIVVRVKRGPEPEWMECARKANRGDVTSLDLMNQYGVHVSEWDWIGSQIDYTISNNGSLNDLEHEIDTLMMNFNR